MSYKITLSQEEFENLKKTMKTQRDSKIYKRLLTIKLKHYKQSNKEIASILDVNIDTITDWIKIYKNKGLEGLCKLHLKGRKKSKLDKYNKEIKDLIEKHTISTISQLQDYIIKLYQIKIEHSWLSRYCKKKSIALIKKQG